MQEWSETLASMARYHALECFMVGEENLTAPEFTSIGENKAISITFTTDIEYINFTELIGYWYSQYVNYNVTDNTCSSLCDQFLQVTWTEQQFVLACMAITTNVFHRWYGLILLPLVVVLAYVMKFTHMHFF